jgi:hypothetical protein
VFILKKEQFDCEQKYQATMCIVKTMLQQKLITDEEFTIIENKMNTKYKPLMVNFCTAK